MTSVSQPPPRQNAPSKFTVDWSGVDRIRFLLGRKRPNSAAIDVSDLSDDHQFLLPNDIVPSMMGLFFRLSKKDVIVQSFSQLYQE